MVVPIIDRISTPPEAVAPNPLKKGDLVRFVSPASTPDRSEVEAGAAVLEAWGFEVDFGEHAFEKANYLAGTDEQRLSDLNAAIRDPQVRAIFATRGGKGSYRIADQLDFACMRADPKFVVGFSDITILHLSLLNAGIGGAVHGAIRGDERDWQSLDGTTSLRDILTGTGSTILKSSASEPTFALTTTGVAHGRLVGGNLDMVTASAGWALPKLYGCILLLEAVNMFLGQVDRQLTMLRKAGHLNGVTGVALGQFTDFKPSGSLTIVDLLREHLTPLGVPILGGLPLGHGESAACVPTGLETTIDCSRGEMRVVGAPTWAVTNEFHRNPGG